MFYDVLDWRYADTSAHIRRNAFSVRINLSPDFDAHANFHYAYFVSSRDSDLTDPFYTGLLLLPEGFSPGSGCYETEKCLWKILNHGTVLEAEVWCIVQGISDIIERWTALDKYFETLLAEDFMNPQQYAKLLFDNDSFSRSQKYFWAIGALNEFVASVTDNIKQMTLYHDGRIKPLVLRLDLAEVLDAMCLTRNDKLLAEENGAQRVAQFKELVAEFESKQMGLVSLQEQFKSRLEIVKTLREGVCPPSDFRSIDRGILIWLQITSYSMLALSWKAELLLDLGRA